MMRNFLEPFPQLVKTITLSLLNPGVQLFGQRICFLHH